MNYFTYFFVQFVKVGALEPAEAEAPATPSKDDSRKISITINIQPRFLTTYA